MSKFGLIVTKTTLTLVLLVLIQQLLVALSTPAISELVVKVSNSLDFMTIGIAVCLLVFIPILMGAIIKPIAKVWELDIVKALISYSLKNNKKKSHLWGNSDNKKDVGSYFSLHIFQVSEDIAYLYLDAFTLFLNVTLSVLAISFFIDWMILIIYLSCALIFVPIYIFSIKRIQEAAVSKQETRSNLSGLMSKYWDNVILDNSVHLKNWLGQYETKLSRDRKSQLKMSLLSSVLPSISTTLSIIYLLGSILLLMSLNGWDKNYLVALIVTVPRQVIMIVHMSELNELIYMIFQVNKEFDDLLEKIVVKDDNNNPADRIKKDEIIIRLNGERVASEYFSDGVNNLHTLLKNHHSGVVDVEGGNGVGKSSLLISIKSMFGDDAVLIPSSSNLISTEDRSGSTGEVALQHIVEAIKSKSKVILLDEWKANLDGENIKKVESLIENAINEKIVIQVNH